MAEHGPDSVALYVSGQLLTEDYYAANKFAKGFLGTGNIDSNSRLCMSSAVAGHRRAFGEDIVPGIYEDLELADLLVLVGSNTAWCHPVLFQRIAAARAARPDMRVVVIDPRRTATCEGADMHLALRRARTWRCSPGCCATCTAAAAPTAPTPPRGRSGGRGGRRRHRGAASAAPAACASRRSTAFFELFARTAKTVTMFSQGVNQSTSGVDKVNAIINVHLLTGRIGKRGAGPFSITGQPNAMGGREVGALSNLLAAHLEFGRPDDLALLREFWGAPNLATGPGLKAVTCSRRWRAAGARAVDHRHQPRRVAAQWRRGAGGAGGSASSSPCPSAPPNDSVAYAHVRLPALGLGREGRHRHQQRARDQPAAPVPAAARRGAAGLVGGRAGRRRLGHGAAFGWRSAADIFREHAALSGTGNDGTRLFDISALAELTRRRIRGDAADPLAAPGQAHRRVAPVRPRRLPDADRPRPHGADPAAPARCTRSPTGRSC